jgi:hypothetical protein
MALLDTLKSIFRRGSATEPAGTLDPECFIYVKLPGNIQPLDRGELFEDRIEPILSEAGLGSISGGGSSLGDSLPDGRRLIEFCGIDIDTSNREAALAALRDLLPKIQAPVGTQLHYTRAGVKLQDEYDGIEWATGRERTFMHPGFNV